MKIEIKAAELQAISLFTGKYDVRYYLNGVAISEGYLVAMNGYYCMAIPLPNAGDTKIIIPNDVIAQVFKSMTVKQKREEVILLDISDITHTLTFGSMVFNFTPIDGIFPSWKQLFMLNIKEPIAHSAFNWDYMALFYKAAKILTCEKVPQVLLTPNGEEAAKIDIKYLPKPLCLLMPQRL